MDTQQQQLNTQDKAPSIEAPVKFCLYARKSTEQDEKQALSIESQVNEMTRTAKKNGLNIVEIKRESHSAKDQGQRPIFSELLGEIREGKFDGIIAWAPDRLSRNAGDLGAVVDLMDQGAIREIRTFGQTFTNSPNEKFLLMILGAQGKLENDQKGVNVQRGLRARCEMGLWPSEAPTGYLNDKNRDKKCHVLIDHEVAPTIRQIFEKVAHEGWTIKRLYFWLRDEAGFRTRRGKCLNMSTIQMVLRRDFYYGRFEYPQGSGNWYTGAHEPIISEELFRKAQEVLDGRGKEDKGYGYKEFAFSKLMKCGLCYSGICAEEKWKHQKNGKVRRYVYYACSNGKDRNCTRQYINEKNLIKQLRNLMDELEFNELKIEGHLAQEIKRYKRFQNMVLGENKKAPASTEVSAKSYIKYILKHGSDFEKREVMLCIKSQLLLKDRTVYL